MMSRGRLSSRFRRCQDVLPPQVNTIPLSRTSPDALWHRISGRRNRWRGERQALLVILTPEASLPCKDRNGKDRQGHFRIVAGGAHQGFDGGFMALKVREPCRDVRFGTGTSCAGRSRRLREVPPRGPLLGSRISESRVVPGFRISSVSTVAATVCFVGVTYVMRTF